ncbi:hypothetical protein BYT27DRAFT_7191026 [Phlegmacium glaucopus]|nr:hypothetical protein BYT27DRAFT_7191026 [Phlegmacium glaucopus]
MEISKKRKRDVDYPRITYEATTKVFDRLFKEESLEEMKNVVRKKLGLSSSLPVHLCQLRDGKAVVLEDDDDFDAFYASVNSTLVVKIKVYFGDDQPPPAIGSGAGLTGGPMQLLESPTVYHAVTDDHSLSKKRKVAFIEPISEPLGDSGGEPKEIQQTLTLDNSSEPSANSDVLPEVPATIDVISVDNQEARGTGDVATQPGNRKESKKKDKAADPTLEGQSLGEQAQVDVVVNESSDSNLKGSTKKTKGENTPHATKSKKRPRTSTADDSVQPVTEVLDGTTAIGTDDTEDHPRSSKKSKQKHKNSEDQGNAATDLTDDGQATKVPEASEPQTPSNGQADPSEADVLTQLSEKKKKSRKKKEVVEVVIASKQFNVASSTSKSIKDKTSNNAIVAQHAKIQDLQLPASTSGSETNPKGRTKNPGLNQNLNMPTKPTLNATQTEKETTSSASAKRKTIPKKSGNKEAPVGLAAVANSGEDQALRTDVTAATRAAVDAILARNSLASKGSRETPTRSSPLVDLTAPSPLASSIAPATSNSPDNQPNNASTTAKQSETVSKCPICDQTPSHARSRCPIIKSGIKAMRQRIAELQRDTPEGDNKEREMVIEELGRIIDKRTQRKTPTAEKKSTNVKSTADKPVVSPTLVADSSRVNPRPGASKAPQPIKPTSQELPHLAESLTFSDVSSYTVRDLEALIRGPGITLADVPSSDSSENEEEVLEDESDEVQEKSFRSQGRIRYPSSSEEGEEEEEAEEASPFVPSIIPLPIKSASELSNEDELSRSGDFRGGISSFHEVNDLGSSHEIDKTGDAAVNDAHALDFSHLSGPEISENGQKVTNDGHILSALDERRVLEESEPESVSDVAKPPVTITTPQSDPIEASEKPSSPQSPIEEDIHPLQSTPKAEVAIRTRSQRKNSTLVRKTTDLTPKLDSVSKTGVDDANGINNKSKSAKKTGGLKRITELPIPVPAIRVIRAAGMQTRRQAREGEEKADEHGPTKASQAKQKNGKLSASTTSPNATKTPAKLARTPVKTPAKVPVSSKGEHPQTKSVTVIQNVLETTESAPSNEEQSLASWAVLQGNSQLENETSGMVDELDSSPNISIGKPASPAVVDEVSEGLDPLFLASDTQQSFPYSQYPNFSPEILASEDEEDEVEASVVKNSSKFRSLTEIARQPTLFTPTSRLARTSNAKEEVMNLYGRARKGSEEESDSDTESDSEAEAKVRTSHIPMSRIAGTSN